MEFSRSHSQKLGMKFFIPVPKVWEWAEPFPFLFPNDQKSFPLTPDLGSMLPLSFLASAVAAAPEIINNYLDSTKPTVSSIGS